MCVDEAEFMLLTKKIQEWKQGSNGYVSNCVLDTELRVSILHDMDGCVYNYGNLEGN